MQQGKYDPISTLIPHDEDDSVDPTPTKTSIAHPLRNELKDEDDLILYETRATNKPQKRTAASYKFVRIFTLGFLMAIVATLLVLCTYMCITTECQSRNYKDLCEEGFCYEVNNVDKLQDSDGDGIGDFIGIKSSLKFLREIGIQTVIIPLSSFASTAAHHDEESFAALTKEGVKVGISAIIRLDDSPNLANLELLNKINSTISGFIAVRDSPYFKDNSNTWTNGIKCYTIVSSPSEINSPSNNCSGTYYESKNLVNFTPDALITLQNSRVTNTSVNIISLESLGSSVENRNEKFLASLVYLSLTNGAISIKAGDELGVNPNGNYSNALNAADTFQKEAFALMKNIKNNRQYSPKIGRNGVIEFVDIDGHPHLKAIQKKCEENGIVENFLAMYNSGDSNITVSMAKTLKNNSAVASMKILVQVNPVGYAPILPKDELTLPAQSIVLVYIKYKPIVSV